MLNLDNQHRFKGQSPLAQWFHQTIEQSGVRSKFQLRGNSLNILCEGLSRLDRTNVLIRLVESLKHNNLNTLIPANQPPIYQVLLYGRVTGQNRPDWTYTIQLNQLDQHLEELHQAQAAPPEVSQTLPEFSSLSRQGTTEARPSTSYSISADEYAVPEQPPVSEQPLVSEQPPVPEQPLVPEQVPAARGASSRGTLVLSNRAQAQKGHPDAIARYLSETLSALGIAVKVSVKAGLYHPHSAAYVVSSDSLLHNASTAPRRLWITCESAYSPTPTLIGEPIAHLLRDLELEGFRDAITLIQVHGEAKPDWVLRVDLTPADEMLREWARWGDVDAINLLINRALVDAGIRLVTAALNDSTLHLAFSFLEKPGSDSSATTAPSQDAITEIVAPLLDTLAPQGIHAATLYGQVKGQDVPEWVHWLDLPASEHPPLAASVQILAHHGDLEAIAFLLNRLLNPELEKQLATGGIRIQLLQKQDLLHIMTEAPNCPQQRHVGPVVYRFLKQLKLAGVSGLRVYGRRAGQKRPLWCYGADFQSRDRLVPEAAPEFAATDAYIGDLITHSDDPVIRPELTPADVQTAWTTFRQELGHRIQHALTRSQLFIPQQDLNSPGTAQVTQTSQQLGLTLVWGAVGLLLMVQADWTLGRLLQSNSGQTSAEPTPANVATASVQPMSMSAQASPPATTLRAEPRIAQVISQTEPVVALASDDSALARADDSPSVFDTSDFLSEPGAENQPGQAPATSPSQGAQVEGSPALPAAPLQEPLPIPQVTLDDGQPYPTFNSQLFDQKLALYRQRLEESGPPDVLIIGSSRALRGVDPAALQHALAKLGYSDTDIFNFGINGATAQVVQLILQQFLTPEQLPKLIIWADGARALNSGSVDVTYNGIVASEGYRQMATGALPNPLSNQSQPDNILPATLTGSEPGGGGLAASLNRSYQNMDRWLSNRLASVSAVYPERDRLKSIVQAQISALLPLQDSLPAGIGVVIEGTAPDGTQTTSGELLAPGQAMMDFDGFLPLSLRFNPATYYQEYARVSGAYDSDYQAFQIEGKQSQALFALLQYTQSHNVPVVFVNLPLTQEYLDPVRAEYEQEFKQFMFSLAVNQSGFIFRDLGQIWLTQYDYFSDPSHLNRYGAYEISNRLAQDAMIPWAEPESFIQFRPQSN